MVFVVRCFRLVGNDGAAEGAAAGERHMKMRGEGGVKQKSNVCES